MNKKIFRTFLAASALAFVLSGCSVDSGVKDSSEMVKENTVVKQSVTEEGFDKLLETLPLAVTKTEYVKASGEDGKTDYISVVLKNNTDADIKEASVAFVAWDENGLPVTFMPKDELGGEKYLNVSEFKQINMIGEETIVKEEGLVLPEGHRVFSCKAIAVRFETFDGEVWENPYFEQFGNIYGGKAIGKEEFEIMLLESSFVRNEDKNLESEMTEEELYDALGEQKLVIESFEYVVQSEELKAIYPDRLKVILRNNTEADIEKVRIAFAAWDEKNLPVKIIGELDFDGGEYIKQVNFDNLAIKSGEVYEEGLGIAITEANKISTFRPIVVYYETVDNRGWKNPYFKNFCELYEEKKLKTTTAE